MWKYLIAAVAYFALGLLWFAPLCFGKRWMHESRLTAEQLRHTRPAIWRRNYIVSFVCCALVVGALATVRSHMFLENRWEWLRVVLVIDGTFVTCSQLPGYLFQKRSLDLFLIDAGYHYIGILLAAAIIG